MAAGLKPEVWYLLFTTFVSKWVEGVVRACGPLRAVYQSTRIYRKSRMGLRRCHSLASNVLPFFLSRHPSTPHPHLQGLWSTSCCVQIHENLQKKSHGLETLPQFSFERPAFFPLKASLHSTPSPAGLVVHFVLCTNPRESAEKVAWA